MKLKESVRRTMYTSIVDYLDKTADLYPEKSAVVDGNERYTSCSWNS